MLANFHYQPIEMLDPAINIALFGIGDWAELVLLLDDFGEVP